jgi:hypothetical protein
MRITHAASLLSLLVVATPAVGQEWFKNPEIDYWNEGRKPKPAKADPEKPKSSEAPQPAGEPPFQWEDYEDPSTDAFWDDGGNYRPPRPLRVAAANPTPENVGRYLRWQKRKIQAISTLQAEVTRQVGVVPEGVELEPGGRVVATRDDGVVDADAAEQAAILDRNPEPIDWRRVEIVFFYSSDCPHCRASVETARALRQQGSKVIPVQVDWQKHAPLMPTSVPYTADIAKEQPVDAVPLWVVAYHGNRITLEGEVSLQTIEVSLKYAEEHQQVGEQQASVQ